MASLDFAVGTATNKVRARVAKSRINIEAKHRQAVERKEDKVKVLTALVDMKDGTAETDEELADLRDLKRRLRTAETQLKVMRP